MVGPKSRVVMRVPTRPPARTHRCRPSVGQRVGQHPAPHDGDLLAQRDGPDHPERSRDAGQPLGVPVQLVGAAEQPGRVLVDRLETGQLARDPAPHVLDRGVDDDLDLVRSSPRRGAPRWRRRGRGRPAPRTSRPAPRRRRPGRCGGCGGRRRCGTSRAGTTCRTAPRSPKGRRPCRGPCRGRAGRRGAAGAVRHSPGTIAAVTWGSGADEWPSGVRSLIRTTASTGSAIGWGRTRMILPTAWPTGSVGSCARPSSTAITRPRASDAVNISGASRTPRPIR